MNRALLIVYEPALFLLAVLGWAGWELWSMRTRQGGGAQKSDHKAPDDPDEGPHA